MVLTNRKNYARSSIFMRNYHPIHFVILVYLQLLFVYGHSYIINIIHQ
ncbi:hypothetical protein SeKA_B0061 (plasmid) [Salmonella enterica subsp. enterica serovar Kentucky str. CVM29188]|nr:hypothetical protein SeKA_B0061 [Salmonella enterica subsp. enterica serovar Kentucky str. CVM29188]